MHMIEGFKPQGHISCLFDQIVKMALAPSTYCLLFPFLWFQLLYAISAICLINFSVLSSVLYPLSFIYSPKLIHILKWNKVVNIYLTDWVYLSMISLWNVIYRSNWFHFSEWIIMSSVTFSENKNYLGD